MKRIFKAKASNLTKKTGSKSATGASKVKKSSKIALDKKPEEMLKSAMKGTTK